MPVLSPLRVLLLGEDRYSKEFQKLVKRTARIGEIATSAGTMMTAGLTVPMGLAGAASVKSALDMNKAMASVGTLIPGQAAELDRYKKSVMDLAAETGISSTVISEGLYETISAFGQESDTLAKLSIATKGAKAGLASVKETLALTSAVTKGYGVQTAEAVQKAADLSFLTVKLGQTTFPELAASMGKVVPLAATLKISQEELFGAMATLTGVTGTAAEVSTQLNSALGAFIKPSAAMTRAAKKMGYESAIAMVKEEGLGGALQKIGDYAGGSEAKLGKMLTRKEGLNAALALLGPQADAFAQKTLAMGDAAGSADEAYREQTEGINRTGHSMAQTTEKVRNLGIKIGDKLLPVIDKLIDKVSPLIEKILDMDDSTLELGLKIAGVVMAAGPLLVVLGKTISLVSVLQAVFGPGAGLAGVLGRLGSPLRSTGVGLAGLNGQSAGLFGNLRGALATAGRIKVPGFGAPVTAAGVVGTAAGVAGAGLLGYELGSAIEKNFLRPQNEKTGKLLTQAESLSVSGVQTAEGIKAAAADIEKTRQALLEGWGGSEVIAGQLMSMLPGVDVEAPSERLGRALDSLNAEQKKLQEKQLAMMQQELESVSTITDEERAAWDADPLVQKYLREIEARDAAKAEADITVRFEGLPEGAKPVVTKKKGGEVRTEGRGAVMDGGI